MPSIKDTLAELVSEEKAVSEAMYNKLRSASNLEEVLDLNDMAIDCSAISATIIGIIRATRAIGPLTEEVYEREAMPWGLLAPIATATFGIESAILNEPEANFPSHVYTELEHYKMHIQNTIKNAEFASNDVHKLLDDIRIYLLDIKKCAAVEHRWNIVNAVDRYLTWLGVKVQVDPYKIILFLDYIGDDGEVVRESVSSTRNRG